MQLLEVEIILEKQAIRNNNLSKLHSLFVSGYVLTLVDDVLEDIRSNVGVSYALYDEGAFRNELKWLGCI